ncbi:MAG: hypothetical protein HeimC2_12150 [Candidatus Heimdallarchaeota archaeon LC_2]|nr:MAG: hypothetical protein HeimC2_12150 [Candidatus Heimdallarchaeota archaeon LC_2]
MNSMNLNEVLKTALLRNSLFSFTAGLILLIFGGVFSSTFGMNSGLILRIIGIVLIIFALQIRGLASNPEKQEWMGWYASINDIFWMIGSIILLTVQPLDISLSGKLVIIIIATVVGYFAYAQLKAIAAITSFYELSREVNVPVEILWPVISDVNGFQKYAQSISSTLVVSGKEEGMVRRCYDLKKQGWNETCVKWIEGEMYVMI